MTRKSATGVVFVVLILASITLFAGVVEIRTRYHEVNALIESKAAKLISVYAIDAEKGVRWRAVAGAVDQSAFDKSDWRANVYLREGKIIKARIESTSESGDWQLTEEYYFYKNGYTAFYFQTLVTFQGYDYEHDRELPPGPYVAEKRVYFDESGKEIKRLLKAFARKSGETIDGKYLATGPMQGEILREVATLPFYASIKDMAHPDGSD